MNVEEQIILKETNTDAIRHECHGAKDLTLKFYRKGKKENSH